MPTRSTTLIPPMRPYGGDFDHDALWVVDEYQRRLKDSSLDLDRMRRIRDAYNGDIVVPVGPVDQEPGVANLILSAVDQLGARIASVAPQVWFPSARPGKDAADRRADDRRDAVAAWWEADRMAAKLRRRARYLVAYATAPAVIRPDTDEKRPCWSVRNPLTCFPSTDYTDPLVPDDFIAATTRPLTWFRRTFPDLYAEVVTYDESDSTEVVVLEYIDCEQISLVYAGLQRKSPTWGGTAQLDSFLPLDSNGARFLSQIPNRAQRPLAVVPGRETLDRAQGQFDQMLGPYRTMLKLTGLEIDAVERGVYPDTYLVSRPGERADFVRGPFDGRTGEVNIVTGGEVQDLATNPGFSTQQMIDRLERAQRLTGGIPAEFGGESGTNIRTGRRGDSVLSAVIDGPIAEAQESLADALHAENLIGIALAQSYWGNTKVSFYLTAKGKPTAVTYVPNEIFADAVHHRVSYPVAGADMNALIVGLGQRLGLGTISKRTVTEHDPLVEDPDHEHDLIIAESLEAAVLASLQQQAAGGALPPAVASRIATLVRTGSDLADAVAQATAEFQAQQAAQAPAAPPGLADSPAAMMGGPEGAPGGAAGGPPTQAPPGIPGPPTDLANLSASLNALRKTNTRSAGREALGGGM